MRLFLLLCGLVALSSCASNKDFASRKYLKGKYIDLRLPKLKTLQKKNKALVRNPSPEYSSSFFMPLLTVVDEAPIVEFEEEIIAEPVAKPSPNTYRAKPSKINTPPPVEPDSDPEARKPYGAYSMLWTIIGWACFLAFFTPGLGVELAVGLLLLWGISGCGTIYNYLKGVKNWTPEMKYDRTLAIISVILAVPSIVLFILNFMIFIISKLEQNTGP